MEWYPAGTLRQNNVVLTSMRRDDVSITSFRRHVPAEYGLTIQQSVKKMH